MHSTKARTISCALCMSRVAIHTFLILVLCRHVLKHRQLGSTNNRQKDIELQHVCENKFWVPRTAADENETLGLCRCAPSTSCSNSAYKTNILSREPRWILGSSSTRTFISFDGGTIVTVMTGCPACSMNHKQQYSWYSLPCTMTCDQNSRNEKKMYRRCHARVSWLWHSWKAKTAVWWYICPRRKPATNVYAFSN